MSTSEELSHRPIDMIWFNAPALLLAVAVLRLPYEYYEVLRVVVTIAAVWIACKHFYWNRICGGWLKKPTHMIFVFAIIAILFNPIIPVHLSKGLWVVIDLVAAFIFFYAGVEEQS